MTTQTRTNVSCHPENDRISLFGANNNNSDSDNNNKFEWPSSCLHKEFFFFLVAPSKLKRKFESRMMNWLP